MPPGPSTTIASTTTTTQATGIKAATKRLDDIRAIGGSVTLFLLMLLGVFAVALAIARIIRLKLHRQLVVVPFANATGQAELDKVMEGLSSLARAELVKHLDQVTEHIRSSAERLELTGLESFGPTPDVKWSKFSPLPSAAADAQLTDLFTSLRELTPAAARPVVAIVQQLFFLPRGMKVEAAVQLIGDKPGTLGITLALSSLDGRRGRPPVTWFEPDLIPKPNGAAAITGPTRDYPTWKTYDRVGRLFDQAGRPKEAVAYLQKAMNRSRRNVLTASALSLAASHLETETRARTPFTLGKELYDAGLVEEAIQYFVKPLPAHEQPGTAQLWRLALNHNCTAPAVQAAGSALVKLARRYEANDVRLYDEALWLYELAQERGTPTDQDVHRLRGRAALLVEAADLLREVNLVKSAQDALDLAGKSLPDDKRVLAARARLLAAGAQETNQDAEAARVMGALLEQREAYPEALSRYEEALSKQPTLQEAAEGMARVLAARPRTLSVRYMDLLNPAMRWLALELARDHLVRNLRWRRCPMCKAQVHNFIGVWFLAAGYKRQRERPGRKPTHAVRFYEFAHEEFKEAISLWPGWYQPYENLGQTLGFWADIEKKRESEFRQGAIRLLEDAAHRCTGTDIRRRVDVNLATAYVLTRDPTEAQKSVGIVERLKNECDLSAVRDAEFLYNLAGWYGLALDLQQKGGVQLGITEEEGLLRLASSFVRDAGSAQPYWDDALTNSDVRPLLGDSDQAAEQKIERFKGLHVDIERAKNLTGPDFTRAVTALMMEAGWVKLRGYSNGQRTERSRTSGGGQAAN